MPTFVPSSPVSIGQLFPISPGNGQINSTYGDLGGSYGAISYVYGGRPGAASSFVPKTRNTGAFTPKP